MSLIGISYKLWKQFSRGENLPAPRARAYALWLMRAATTNIIQEADALYKERAEREKVRASVELLRSSAANNYEAAWRLARAHFFLGQEAADERQAREDFKSGIRAARRALDLEARRVEGHFWLGVNLALLAAKEKFPFALIRALRARKALERAIEINPNYHGAGPLRVLARLQHKLPRMLGGGHHLARANFERAVLLAPSNTVTRIYFAELLSEIGNEAEAQAHLAAVLNAPDDPAWSFEAARDRQIAQGKMEKPE